VLAYMIRIFWPAATVPVIVILKPFAVPAYALLVEAAPALAFRSIPSPQPHLALVVSSTVAPEIQHPVVVQAVAVMGDGDVHVDPSP